MSEQTTAEERATIRRWAAQGYFLMLGTSRGLGLVSRLLDDYDRLAAERDRHRVAVLPRSFTQEDWGHIELSLKHIVRNDVVDDNAYDAYNTLYERVKAINRAGLVPETGNDDG